MNASQLDFAIKAKAAFDEALADARAGGVGLIRIRRLLDATGNLPVERIDIERLAPTSRCCYGNPDCTAVSHRREL